MFRNVFLGIVADGKCRYGDKVFNDGEEAPIYHKTGDVFNDYCELCECIKGNLTDCMHIKCDTGLMGCKEIVYPSESGECCPKCKSEPLRRSKYTSNTFSMKNSDYYNGNINNDYNKEYDDKIRIPRQ